MLSINSHDEYEDSKRNLPPPVSKDPTTFNPNRETYHNKSNANSHNLPPPNMDLAPMNSILLAPSTMSAEQQNDSACADASTGHGDAEGEEAADFFGLVEAEELGEDDAEVGDY